MAITDPRAVKFANENARVAADLFAQGYYRAKAAIDQVDAQGLEALFPDAETVEDGADVDGRSRITGAHVTGVITAMRALVADMEANGSAKLNAILQVAVNTRRA